MFEKSEQIWSWFLFAGEESLGIEFRQKTKWNLQKKRPLCKVSSSLRRVFGRGWCILVTFQLATRKRGLNKSSPCKIKWWAKKSQSPKSVNSRHKRHVSTTRHNVCFAQGERRNSSLYQSRSPWKAWIKSVLINVSQVCLPLLFWLLTQCWMYSVVSEIAEREKFIEEMRELRQAEKFEVQIKKEIAIVWKWNSVLYKTFEQDFSLFFSFFTESARNEAAGPAHFRCRRKLEKRK